MFENSHYGTASAPIIATKCLQVLREEIKESHRKASKAISFHFYIDDLMIDSHSVEAAINVQKTIRETLKKAKFPLLKYALNSKELPQSIDSSLTEKILKFKDEGATGIHGLKWNPQKDEIALKVKL